jgi:hypothetical protein
MSDFGRRKLTAVCFVPLLVCATALVAQPTSGGSTAVVPAAALPPMDVWPSVRDELTAMDAADQSLRAQWNALLNDARAANKPADETAMSRLRNQVRLLDEAHQTRLAEIVSKLGWPPRSKVGSRAASTALGVMQNAPLSFQLAHVERLRQSVALNEADPPALARLEDQILVQQNKPQRYGTQVLLKDGVTIFPTLDEANLDARRQQMGLLPICDYLATFTAAHAAVVYPRCVKSAAR